MEYNMFCKSCNCKPGLSNFGNARDINNKSMRYCRNCSNQALSELQKQLFVESYKGTDIYKFNNRYYPYWGSSYSFESLEDCKNRIDNKHIAIIPIGLLNKVMQGEDLL